MSNILIGVTGGISAYKIASVVSVLYDKGHTVRVIMSESAKKFITPLTLSALSHQPVFDDATEFSPNGHITHVELAEWADAFIIAPMTANTGAKLENKIADNLLTSTALVYKKNKIVCFPAMNNNMWDKFYISYIQDSFSNYVKKENIDSINFSYNNLFTNVVYIEPDEGKMACGSIGKGKLVDTKNIINITERLCTYE